MDKLLSEQRTRILGEFTQKEVNLTEQELKKLVSFEYAVLYDNGLKWTNGSYSEVEIIDFDEDEAELILQVRCGVQDMGGGGEDYHWRVRFNRETLTTEEY